MRIISLGEQFYPQGFPPCYMPQELVIYKIPILQCSDYFYMKPDEDCLGTHAPVIVATLSFLLLWKDSPQYDDPPFKAGVPYAEVPKLWEQDRGLLTKTTKQDFTHGITNPVPLPIIMSVSSDGIFLREGITRLLWLFINNAKAFPIMCPKDHASLLTALAGVNLIRDE